MSHQSRRRTAGSGGSLSLLILLVLIGWGTVGRLQAQQIPRFRIREVKARVLFKKGLYFYNAQQYIAAREFFYKALNIHPAFHLARRYLGDSYYYSGDWDAALEQWEFLDDISGGGYPLVRQRSELVRFYFNRERKPGPFVFLREFTPQTWRGREMAHPVDLALDSENRLYILNYESANILVVNPGGTINRVIRGPLFNRLQGPIALKIRGDRLYICEYEPDRVRVFSLIGNELFAFGATGDGPGQFRGPSGIAVSDRAIFVSDSSNRRIQKFSIDGKFLASFGVDDRGRRPLSPAGLALDGKGELYAVDNGRDRILRYDRDGNYLGEIRNPDLKKPRNIAIIENRLLITDEQAGVFFFNLSSREWDRLDDLRNENDRPVLLNRPFAARMEKDGILYVAEYGAHRVLTAVPRGMRYSNLDVRIQRIDTRTYPDLAIFLTVKNRQGRPIRGLTRREFLLFENDTRVGGLRTDNVRIYNQRTNIAMVKENSVEFRDNYNEFLAATMGTILEKIRITDRINVIRVGRQVRAVYGGLMRKKIVKTLLEGDVVEDPNIGKGLYEALTSLLPEIGPRYALLLTSGRYFPGAFNQYSIDRIIQYAGANGIKLMIISYEGEKDERKKELIRDIYTRLAVETGGRYIQAFDETKLNDIYPTMMRDGDRRYIITYRGGENRNLRGRYVDVRVEVHHLKTYGKGDGGYFVPEVR